MSTSILYNPTLNQITGGVTSTLLMSRLEFWFSKSPKGTFYKFMAPCDHECYVVGDSWTEELGFSLAEFRTAFKRIGVVYKSKKAFKTASDPFKGKPYLSYFDRIRKLTFYLRNDDFFKKHPVQANPLPSKTATPHTLAKVSSVSNSPLSNIDCEDKTASNHTATCPSLVSTDSVCETGISLNTQKLLNTQKESESLLKDPADSLVPFSKILTLIETNCPSLNPHKGFSAKQKAALSKLWQQVAQRLDLFEKAFQLVYDSDFLSGRLEGHPWHATLDWIFQKTNFDKILNGNYRPFKKAATIVSHSHENSSFFKIQTHDWDYDALQALEDEYIDQQLGQMPDTPFLPPNTLRLCSS